MYLPLKFIKKSQFIVWF